MANEAVAATISSGGFSRLLGLQVEELADDYCRVRLPFREEVVTVGDLVHGGAIASILDAAATAAAWSTVEDVTRARGTTIGFSINYLQGARSADVVAEARVIKRGRSIIYIEVTVTDGASECARGLVTYKLDQG
jgi:uncharacterized protein (TIGR00369 family)